MNMNIFTKFNYRQRKRFRLYKINAYFELFIIRKREDRIYILHGIKPVSYTHLDVYKRQAMPRSRAAAAMSSR